MRFKRGHRGTRLLRCLLTEHTDTGQLAGAARLSLSLHQLRLELPHLRRGCFDTDHSCVEFSTQRTIIKTRNHLPGLDRVTLFNE
ncbi:hypothetical protein XFEB_00508 [Xylella fastidiosa EB92.1]|nr:hypothetical protein XFEB_00508 [Xylella fastidiosa EB92.1]